MTQEEQIKDLLKTSSNYFEQIPGKANWRDGWKISLQGHTIDDAMFLLTSLVTLLEATHASYKIGTQKLIDLGGEQSTKLLTIYIPNGVDARSYAELVRLNIEGYNGADDILEKRSYTKYAPGIFFRNDRDEDGKYINA